MTIAVFGATGGLGELVIRELIERGQHPLALGRSEQRLQRLAELGARTKKVDMSSVDDLVRTLEGVQGIISCLGASPRPGFSGRAGFSDVDVELHEPIIAASERAGVERAVYVSCHAAEQYPKVAYLRAHHDVEENFRASRILTTVVRPTGFFSVFETFFSAARWGFAPLMGAGKVVTNPIHDLDLATCCVDALDSSESVISAGGPDVLSRRDTIGLAFEALGKRPRFLPVPLFALRGMGRVMRPFHPRMGELMLFIAAIMDADLVAPVRGQRRLGEFYRELASTPR